ncbi:hypothetical protein PGB90_004109 [Kerria lacca]
MATFLRRSVFSYIGLYSNISRYLKYRIINPVSCATQFSIPNFSKLQYSTQVDTKIAENGSSKSAEQVSGHGEKREFQAETQMLLDIVAKSLYSNNEVFLRELISNASDALEKHRYAILNENSNEDIGALEIRISSDKQNRILIIQDNGIGMTKEELISNLGTIAKSGSKAFLEELKNKSVDASSIIGQFGVGFYSCFMVANKVEVYTKARGSDIQGYYWVYDGSGAYEIQDARNVSQGTKIIIHLRSECREFADESKIKDVIQKYSNFINFPIYINGEKTNTIQPLWLVDQKSITKDQHTEFYRFISNNYDIPRFIMHFSTDAPLTIRALLYIPSKKQSFNELTQECGVSLYTRRVLIKNKAQEVLPKWCNFIKGVVDFEDIPLNLSRELLQNSPLIAKLRNVLTSRVIKFLKEKSDKEPKEYEQFYTDYNIYLKAGISYTDSKTDTENIATLLRYETSMTKSGETKSLMQYCKDQLKDEQKIYYLFAPSRALAESSPYLETLKKNGVEVLFCYEVYDEQVLSNLGSFNNRTILSAEEQLKKDDKNILDLGENALSQTNIDSLLTWSKEQLRGKASNVKLTNKLDSHPCVITVENMATARHFLKSQLSLKQFNEEMKYSLLSPCLELNPKHPVIKKLDSLITQNPNLASLLIKQLFYNAMLAADLIEDAGSILINMNELLILALEKY